MNMVFGNKLREQRIDNGLKQEDIAKLLNVSKTTICQWETHKQEPSLEDVVKIAIYFKISSDYLLGLEDESGAKIYNNYGIHNGDVNF